MERVAEEDIVYIMFSIFEGCFFVIFFTQDNSFYTKQDNRGYTGTILFRGKVVYPQKGKLTYPRTQKETQEKIEKSMQK